MQCPSCQAAVPEGGKFCMECGTPIPRACPGCGRLIPAAAKFCSECGASLIGDVAKTGASPKSAARKQSTPVPPSTAERRQLTVMFCDLVGSTALALRLDPEDLRDIISAYHRCVTATVGRFDGFVAKYMGDGVLVYFGYPQAHEDDAERAVRAGLALVTAVPALKTCADVGLQCRIGIATGVVVVGDLIGSGEAEERDVVGETPNLASRLQSLAAPDSVVIAPSTRWLLGDLFEYRHLGAVVVKGLPEPMQAYQVLRESVVESRFEALHAAGLIPLVGREEEIALLLRRWQRAKGGEGQVVLLSGEAGIGKSRIAAALQEKLQAEPHTRLRYFCSAYHTDSALHPVINQLERAAGFERENAVETKLNKFEALLAPASPPGEDVALLAELLSIPTGDRYPPLCLSPQRKKEKTFEALLHQLEFLTRQRPVLMVYEDVHWIDASSRELLDVTIERAACLPVLILVTFRPEFQPPWAGLSHVTMLALNRLGRCEALAMSERVADGKALPSEILDQIMTHTDGVPLFVEELTKTVLETGLLRDEGERYVLTAPLPSLAIPTTLHASLMARLDRLAPLKEVAQIGAVIGRKFSYELLAAVSPLREEDLHKALGELASSELVFRRGALPNATYSFKHALVQDAAYSTLLRGKRQELHACVARALKERFPETVAAQPELLAHHYTQAGLAEPAIEYRRRAGELAITRSAMVEAIAQLRLGLDLIPALSDAPERWRHELGLQVALGRALNIAKGHAAPEAGIAYARALELCQKTGNTPHVFAALWGQYSFHLNRAELHVALQVAKELLRLGQRRHDVAAEITGHRIVGAASVSLGRSASGRAHLEQAVSLYNARQHRSLVPQYGYDTRVVCASYLSWTLFAHGYPDQALARSREALNGAQDLSHPYTTAHALFFRCTLDQFFGDRHGVRTQAPVLISLCTEQKFPFWLALGTILQGWALADADGGRTDVALEQIRRGLAAYWATGAQHWSPYLLALLADAHRNAGELGKALDVISEALERVKKTGERWYEAELHRWHGEVLLQTPVPNASEAAEACFQRALAVARRQTAKLYELRAAASLARLWRDRGRCADARDILAQVYGWFTEGFDACDLREGKALLDEVG